MKALDRKLWRDLWHMRGQALAIALVLAAATSTFVLSFGVQQSLIQTRETYYQRNGFADVFVNLTRAPRGIIGRLAAVPGVRVAEGSIQQYATLDMPGREVPVRALVNSLAERTPDRLNRITLRTGRMPAAGSASEVLVDEAFAEAAGLAPGDSLAAIIYGRRLDLQVVGTALAPDYIYALPPGDIIPDSSRFGIVWMGEQALEAATDRKEAINAAALLLDPDASEPEVIRQVDAILAPYGGTGAYGRADHLSHAFLDNELAQLDAMSMVIPPVFLLVAAFLVYVVLGRMIANERSRIGLLKAFGYSNWAVAVHYLKFALVIAVLAIIGGSAAGIWMGRAMTAIYAEYFRFPFLEFDISPRVFFLAAVLVLATTLLGATGGMYTVSRLSPAVSMAAAPPPVYRRGLVERLGQLAGFTPKGHMIARHIARWPARSAITTLGVAMAMALLFATLQFLDASRVMLDSFFYRAQGQDLTVTFTEQRSEAAIYELQQIPGVLRVEPVRAAAARISFADRTERVAIEGAADDARLSLRIDRDGQVIGLPASGLLLSRQLADKLAVRVGDAVDIELLGGRRTVSRVRVAGVVDEYVGERVYAGLGTMRQIVRDQASIGSALLRIDSRARDRILARLKDRPGVLGVTEKTAAMGKFEQMIDDNMYTMLFFYIAFASAIAVGVVYNSARILFSERAHELATLRVLGYFRREVGAVLVGELAVLIVVALPLGCLLGFGLAQLMTALFSSDLFRLPFSPARATYGVAALVVLCAAALTSLGVALRVSRLDMVRVLKGRD